MPEQLLSPFEGEELQQRTGVEDRAVGHQRPRRAALKKQHLPPLLVLPLLTEPATVSTFAPVFVFETFDQQRLIPQRRRAAHVPTFSSNSTFLPRSFP